MGMGEGVNCGILRRHHTSEANEPQPNAAGSPDSACGQPEYLRLDAVWGSDPELVERAVEEAAREAAAEGKIAGGMSAVHGLVAHPARAWAATCAAVEGSQE
jgi:hypothetical protein